MSAVLHVYQPSLIPFEPDEVITVRQMADAWRRVNEKKMTRKVFLERWRTIELFCVSYGDKAAVKMRRWEVEDWMALQTSWVSDHTIKRNLGAITLVFKWAAKTDRIEHNPINGLSHPPGGRGRPLTIKEFTAFLRTAKAIFRRVLIFLRFTGCRPGELAVLEWRQIQMEERCAILEIHKTARSRKDRAPRRIILHPVVVKLLIWIRRHQREGEKFVFLQSRKKPWRSGSLCMQIWRLREELGIEKSAKLYGTRHLFGTEFWQKVGDLKMLAELLGHTTTKMAEHYVHAGKTPHLEEGLLKMFAAKSKKEFLESRKND